MSNTHYVIVGAGTAGPVIAARLSEDPDVEVALLEAGRENTNGLGRSQGAFFLMFGSEADWNYKTTAQPGIGGRDITHPRGKSEDPARSTWGQPERAVVGCLDGTAE